MILIKLNRLKKVLKCAEFAFENALEWACLLLNHDQCMQVSFMPCCSFWAVRGLIYVNKLYMFINVVMRHWRDARSLGKLYIAIMPFFMTCMMICYAYKIEKRVVSQMAWGWINESFEILCGRCCVRREPRLWLTAIVWITRPCVAHSIKLNYEVSECVTCAPLPFLCSWAWLFA